MVDEVAMVIVPAGQARLVLEEADHQTRARDQQAHLFGEDRATRMLGDHQMKTAGQANGLARLASFAAGRLLHHVLFPGRDGDGVGVSSDRLDRAGFDR